MAACGQTRAHWLHWMQLLSAIQVLPRQLRVFRTSSCQQARSIFEPVLGHGRNGEDFTFLTVHDVDDFLDKGWGFVLLGSILSIFPVFGNSDAVELVDAVIDGA